MKLKLLFVIVNRNKTEHILAFLRNCGADYINCIPALGTAPNSISEIFGIGETEKSLIITALSPKKTDRVMKDLREKYDFCRRGEGIAFTVPICSVGGPATLKILAGIEEEIENGI